MFSSDSHVLVALRVAWGRGTCLQRAQEDTEQIVHLGILLFHILVGWE